MNKIYKQVSSIVILILFFTLGMPAQRASAQYDDAYVSYNDFYENLAPYGQWIEDPQYGYVWSPNEDENFRPYYTNGYWAMTDYGNTWVSNYPWGWACFHYGRWTYDPFYGWLWIPGSHWGPAWVSWRYGSGYYGWAPLGPGFEFTSTYGDYSCPNDWWVFIPPQYLFSGNYYRYWYGPRGNTHIIQNTVFINNTYVNNNVTYVSGPRTREIEEVTHQPVQVYRINNSNNLNTRVRRGNVIRMYRPAEIRPAASVSGVRPTPPNVVRAPQAVRTPQAVNLGQGTPPQFRNTLPRQSVTPGTNFNETAQPRQQTRNDNNPYEWDVNRQQHHRDEYERPQQQNWQRQPAQQPQNNYRPQQQPVQRNEPQRQAPAPTPAPMPRQAPAPQPQRAPAPAPAPQPPRENGRR